MSERVSTATAKARFSELVAEAAYGGKRFIIERRGRPLAALIGLADLERLEQERPLSTKPLGALALVGAWSEIGDDELDKLVADIYAAREKDSGRPVEIEE